MARTTHPPTGGPSPGTGGSRRRPHPGSSSDILVVEDDDDAANLLMDHLDRLDHIASRVSSGEQALELVDTATDRPFRLVIVDLLLPGISGWELVTALRQRRATTGCAIVVSSVLAQQDYPRDVQAVLPKPYTHRQIEELMRRFLP